MKESQQQSEPESPRPLLFGSPKTGAEPRQPAHMPRLGCALTDRGTSQAKEICISLPGPFLLGIHQIAGALPSVLMISNRSSTYLVGGAPPPAHAYFISYFFFLFFCDHFYFCDIYLFSVFLCNANI